MTITGWEGVCVASRILTTKIPSMLLVAVMWLQRTWYPRFRHDTFGYGTTVSPNIREISMSREVSMRMHVSSPKVPKCTCYANACSKRDIFLYKLLLARSRRISSRFDRSKYLWQGYQYKEYLSASTCIKTRGFEGILVDGDNMLTGENYHWRLNSKIKTLPNWYGRTEKVLFSCWQKPGSHMYKGTIVC
jgi:hypothetical protein